MNQTLEMENNLHNNVPVIVSKRIWSTVRILYFLLRKSISKGKLLMDLGMMMKRGKIASKAMISNLMFHHHHHSNRGDCDLSFTGAKEYEFSCSNTPNYSLFPTISKRSRHGHNHFFTCAQLPSTKDDEMVTAKEVQAVLEMLNNKDVINMIEASPALPGFGRTPMVRQLRITDSPFPLRDAEDDPKVDEEAQKFIRKFYKELRNQKS